jgi:hypothetical protein
MSKTLSDLTAAIEAKLKSIAPQGSDVLREDAQDLESKINVALGELGMLMLISEPEIENNTPLSRQANWKITLRIAIGENPLIWRDEPLTKPVCMDVMQLVVRSLQGFSVLGFQPLRCLRGDLVPDKKRQLYEVTVETLLIMDPL